MAVELTATTRTCAGGASGIPSRVFILIPGKKRLFNYVLEIRMKVDSQENKRRTVGKYSNSFIIVSGYLNDVIFPRNQIRYKVIFLSFICYISHGPRALVVTE